MPFISPSEQRPKNAFLGHPLSILLLVKPNSFARCFQPSIVGLIFSSSIFFA